jgi:hypothetical protein
VRFAQRCRRVRCYPRIQYDPQPDSNHLGLNSEEIGPSGDALGSFRQAFTYVARVSATTGNSPRRASVSNLLEREPCLVDAARAARWRSRHPFVAIVEGEVAILDAAGNEIVRHRTFGVPGRGEPPDGADRLPDRSRQLRRRLRR